MRALLSLMVVALVIAGCGADGESGRSGEPSVSPPAPAAPEGPAPKLGMDGPPPAWIETGSGSRWLAYSTYCWKTVCADYMPPRCGSRHGPVIAVEPGERVTFHLGFEPQSVGLLYIDKNGFQRPIRLEASRATTWQVTRPGAAWLSTTADAGRDANYALCVDYEARLVSEVVESGASGLMTVEGSLLVERGRSRLCAALAESFPPQCGGPSLAVTNADSSAFPRLAREGDVAWSDRPVELTGTVADGRITLADGG